MRKRRPSFAPTTAESGASFHCMLAGNQKPIEGKREQMVKASLIAVVGLICATMLALGFGLVVPVSGVVGDLFIVLAVGSGIFFVGLLDGE